QEPFRPAVIPPAWARAADHGDRVTGHGELVVDHGVGRRQVHAAVADVGGALVDDRPRGRVVVVAAEGEPHRPVDELVVVAGGAFLAAADHPHRVVLLDGQVGSVRGRHGGPAGGDRPVVGELAADVDLSLVGAGVG